MAGKTENRKATKKILMKEFDLEEPTSFLDPVYLGCTQRECTISNDIVTNYRDMFESRISSGVEEKLPTRASGKPDAETVSSWSYDMESHANLQRKRLNNFSKSQHHARMTINLKKRKVSV